jgi:hypothetical protein
MSWIGIQLPLNQSFSKLMKIYWYVKYLPASYSYLFSNPLLSLFVPHILFSFQNGPTQFVSGSKLPLPKEKHDETLCSTPEQPYKEQPESDSGFDVLDLPEVPKSSLQSSASVASAPAVFPSFQAAPHPNIGHESPKHSGVIENPSQEPHFEPEEVMQERSVANENEQPSVPVGGVEDKQFLPFISPPSLSSASFSATHSNPPATHSRAKSEANVDLQDVLAAAQAAAESAERAAAAARSAASLAKVRIVATSSLRIAVRSGLITMFLTRQVLRKTHILIIKACLAIPMMF